MTNDLRIAFIGGGNITRCILNTLLKSHCTAANVFVSNRGEAKLTQLANEFGVNAAVNNSAAIEAADVAILAVKPQFVRDICQEVAGVVRHKKPLIISLAAATRVDDILSWFAADNLGIVRTMTNTATTVGMGTTVMFANAFTTPEQKRFTENFFNAVGSSFWVEKEADLNIYSPLIGSGPAYVFLLIEAIQQAAAAHGISAPLAAQVTLSIVRGAVELAVQSNTPASELRQRVTTPNGITASALQPLLDSKFFDLFHQAVAAGDQRGKEIEAALRQPPKP